MGASRLLGAPAGRRLWQPLVDWRCNLDMESGQPQRTPAHTKHCFALASPYLMVEESRCRWHAAADWTQIHRVDIRFVYKQKAENALGPAVEHRDVLLLVVSILLRISLGQTRSMTDTPEDTGHLPSREAPAESPMSHCSTPIHSQPNLAIDGPEKHPHFPGGVAPRAGTPTPAPTGPTAQECGGGTPGQPPKKLRMPSWWPDLTGLELTSREPRAQPRNGRTPSPFYLPCARLSQARVT